MPRFDISKRPNYRLVTFAFNSRETRNQATADLTKRFPFSSWRGVFIERTGDNRAKISNVTGARFRDTKPGAKRRGPSIFGVPKPGARRRGTSAFRVPMPSVNTLQRIAEQIPPGLWVGVYVVKVDIIPAFTQVLEAKGYKLYVEDVEVSLPGDPLTPPPKRRKKDDSEADDSD